MARRQLPLSRRRRRCCDGIDLKVAAGIEGRDRRPDRRRQIDAARAVAALLRSDAPAPSRSTASMCANTQLKSLRSQIAHGAAAAADLPAVGARQHRLWPARRRSTRRSRARRGWRASTTLIARMPEGYDTLLGEGGVALVRRREAAHHDRPRPAARRADPDPRRADLGARCRDRGAGHGRRSNG